MKVYRSQNQGLFNSIFTLNFNQKNEGINLTSQFRYINKIMLLSDKLIIKLINYYLRNH